MNRQLNQVYIPKQTIKNSDFQQSSFFNIGRKFKLARKTCSKATFIFMDEIFDYFSTETGKRLGYKILNVKKLKEELGISKSSLYRAIQEVNEKEIFIVLPTSENKFILYFINEQSLEIKRQVETGELIVSLDVPKPKFSKTNITNLPGKIVVSNLGKEVPENENTFPKITNIESNMKQAFPKMIQVVPNLGKVNIDETTINSEVETSSKSSQESYIKETIYKETSSLDHLDSSSKKPNLEKIEMKKNDDDFFKNDLKEKKEFDFLEFENTRKEKPVVLKDLNELELQVQAFLTKDLGIEDQRLFFTYIRKLPNDLIMSKARYVAQKMAAKQVANPESYLNKLLATELAKNETTGNVGVDGRVKRNDFKQIILFFSEIKNIDGNKNITRTNSIDSANNIEINKKNIAFELYRLFCFQNKAEIKAKLEYFMKEMPKFLHLQDFKEILETEKLLDQAKKDILIDMFRENM